MLQNGLNFLDREAVVWAGSYLRSHLSKKMSQIYMSFVYFIAVVVGCDGGGQSLPMKGKVSTSWYRCWDFLFY